MTMIPECSMSARMVYLRAAASLQTSSRAMAVEKAARNARQGAMRLHHDFLLLKLVPPGFGPEAATAAATDPMFGLGAVTGPVILQKYTNPNVNTSTESSLCIVSVRLNPFARIDRAGLRKQLQALIIPLVEGSQSTVETVYRQRRPTHDKNYRFCAIFDAKPTA